MERSYLYTVENRLPAVYDRKELLMAAAYDGDSSSGGGNATNAETNNSQNQSGILFPTEGEASAKEEYLISLIKTSGKEKDYELTEYISDVNRTYAEVLVEQNCSGAMDTAYVYGSGRISLDRFDGSTGYYLYDGRGSVTGISNGEGQVCRSYRYAAFGEITYGAPQYENIYAYNGESYSPNVGSLYLRARYYNIAAGSFFTEDSYLGDIREPLTLNRYVYCEGNPVNYKDPSGHIMLGNTDISGLIRGEENGEIVFYFPDSFSEYAENRLAEKAAKNQQFMDSVEEFLLYNPVGQGIAVISSALFSPVTGTAILLRDQQLENAYGEKRDWAADFFETNNNFLVGAAGSFHGTYQLLRDPSYLIYGAAYVLENPNGTIFRDPLERPLAMLDAFWEGDNKCSVRYAGQAVGYAVQAALVRQAVRSCKNQTVPNESNVRPPKTVPQELARNGKVPVIGKMKDLNIFGNVSNGEFKIADYLPDMGNPQANWYQNSGILRSVMNEGVPIKDVSVFPMNSAGFLGAERNLLQNSGWTYFEGYWYPPQ